MQRLTEIVLALVLAAALLHSCAKEAWEPESVDGSTHVVKMTLSPSESGAEVRSAINESAGAGTRKVTWKAADEICYWTCKTKDGTPSAKQKHTVLADAEKEEIPVTYRDNDEYVTFYTAGTGITSVTCSDMTNITFAVPQSQDGTFAGCHAAVHKSKVIMSASAAAMKPVGAMLRFTMSSLTYSGKIVNKIRVGCMNTAAANCCWGNYKVKMNNSSLGSISSVDYDGGTANSYIEIDKSASAFQANVPYYVAVRPKVATYASGLYLDLYNGSTRLGRVYVKDSSGGLTLTYGQIRDLGDISPHVNIGTTQMTIYPPYAAFTKDMTKRFWVKVEPEDFTGTIEWKVGNTTNFTCTYTSGAKENLTLEDGTVVSCWYCDVSKGASISTYDRYTTTVTATAKVTGESDVTKSVNIEMGKFVDLGCEDNSGNRVLWSDGYVGGSVDPNNWNYGTERAGVNELTWDSPSTGTLSTYSWGYLHKGKPSAYGRWNGGSATTDRTGGKYNTTTWSYLEDSDNVVKYCMQKFTSQGEAGWDFPKSADLAILKGTVGDAWNSSTARVTSKHPYFKDCKMYIKSGRIWTKDGCLSNGAAAIYLQTGSTLAVQVYTRNYWQNNAKPIKRVSK